MQVINLLFSPVGRMSRLNFTLMSSLFGTVNFALLIYFFTQSQLGLEALMHSGPLALLESHPLFAALFFVGMWIQSCFVFKRSADMGAGAAFGLLFIVLGFVPYLRAASTDDFASTAASPAVIVCGVVSALMGLVLLFKNSIPREEQNSIPNEQQTNGIQNMGALDEKTDLVARAAELRALDAANQKLQNRVQKHASAKAPQKPGQKPGFGRRKAAAFAGK